MNLTLRRAGLLLIALAFLAGQAPPPPEPPEAPEVSEAAPGQAAGEAEEASSASSSTAPTPPRVSSLPSGANVAIIPVRGVIYDFTYESLQRRVDRAVNNGASVIVLEIDTYGGVVTAALDIAKYLKDPTRVPVPTVAWVNNKAYSAGIMIASACDEIVMAPASATGDCAPIVPGQNLSPTERAKAFSPIAAEFKNSAARNGYTYATFHAMCVLGVELYLIEDPDTGDRLVVNQADYAVMVNGDMSAASGLPIQTPTNNAPTGPTLPLPGGPAIPLPGGAAPATGSGTAAVSLDLAEAEQFRPEDVGRWVAVTTLPSGQPAANGRIHSGVGTLFTPDDVLAADIDLSRATVQNDADLQRYLGAASLTRIDLSWSERLARLLSTNWLVRIVLIVLLVLGVFLELQAPGLGIPGAVALFALVGLFGAPMLIGLADVWHVLLFAVGLILLVAEFATGGASFGVLGVVGIIVMLAALVLAVVPTSGGFLPTGGTWDQALASLMASLVGLLLAAVGLGVLFRYLGNVPGLNRLVLADAQANAAAAPAAPHVAGMDVLGDGQIAVGDTGTVVSPCRPAGEANINGRLVDVTSDAGFLEPGTEVRVTETTRFSITVDTV